MANSRYYEYLQDNVPVQQPSGQTTQAAYDLAEAEAAAQRTGYGETADARLDRAINEALAKSGYKYDVSKDKAYQEFARQYSQNALSGRAAAQESAKQLAGGYDPTYADAVGSEVYRYTVNNLINYQPTFRAAANREAAAAAAQAAQTAQILSAIDDTKYSRGRDQYGDRVSFVKYLADRYSNERQSDIQRSGFASDVYRARLSAEQQNLNDQRKIENSRYQFDNQSAESSAKLAEDNYEFNRKLEYTAAKDAYDDRSAAAKAAETAAKEAAANAKTAANEAKQLEKAKNNYGYDAYLIQRYLANEHDLTEKEGYALDYNKDGVVDNKDLLIAKRASETGEVQYNFDSSGKANNFIAMIRRNGSHYGTLSAKTLEKLVKDSGLSDSEAAYVYAYFGV